MPDTYRVYLNHQADCQALAAFLLTKLGVLGTVGPGYVEVLPTPELTEDALLAAVDEWISSVEFTPSAS